MDVGSILLLLALVILVGAFIARPLRGGGPHENTPEVNVELSELLAERERVLDALAELDFDNEMGKVPDTLYPMQRKALVKRGADVLRLLDERMPATEQSADGVRVEYDREDPIEALIAVRRMIATPTIAKKDTKSNFCTKCGAKLHSGDKFCPSCGKKL